MVMVSLPQALRGPALMVLATGSFVINDSFMKLATEGLPPLEVLFLRGIAATLWCLPLVLMLGYRTSIKHVFDRYVLLRNLFELCGVLCFVVALANMPIANVTALGQVTPLLFLVGMAAVMREKIGGLKIGLIGLGFVGAMLVAQPSAAGISGFALLALLNAAFCAARDIAGRRVPAEVPGLIVAFCAILLVAVGAGAATLAVEDWVAPDMRHLLLLGAAGLFLMIGHFAIFMAYRIGEAATVAPFYYMFSVWAVISGIIVFNQVPNPLALSGIALIIAGGLAIVLLDERKRRLIPVA
ncbi:MAG: hypothetical protein JWR75_122 [Devosia sp.]|nr:hypothetical protein [Devosia sp.]